MKTKRQIFCGLLTAVMFAAGSLFLPTTAVAQPSEGGEEAEVLTRGPVHEAFAEAVSFDPEAGIIVPKQPPEPIEEVQPDQRPVGDNVTWIPGYWAWDDDENDFFWISGVWRNLPPGREWVPGYWAKVDSGHQWTSGYWEDAEAEEVSYLPAPPRSLEKGPNVKASSDNQTWVPGNWEYRENNYAWRAGYWVDARENWAWTPAYYRWTPRGHVYVDGYWDYPVARRGVVFAPVRFREPYYERPDYYYTPATVVALAVFTNHLFVRPRYNHYYFGDYYDSGYRERYYASYDYGHRYRGYDPIFVHSRWEHRHDRNWERQRREYFEYRRDNVGSRPPRTWAAYNRLPERDRQRGEFRMADRLDRVAGNREGNVRFQKVSDNERQRFAAQRKEVRNYGRQRQQREATGDRARSDGEGRGQASRAKVNRSPVSAKRDNRDEKAGGPPPRLQRRSSGNENTANRGDKKDGDNARPGEKRGDNAAAGNGNREERTKPGQRRDDGQAARKPNQNADGNNNREGAQKKNDNQPGNANRGEGKQGGQGNRDNQGAEKKKATPGNADKTPAKKADPVPQPKRQANPERKAEKPPVKKQNATPSKPKSNPQPAKQQAQKQQAQKQQPQKKANPQPAKQQAQKKANPQLARQQAQQKANPQRQQQQRQKAKTSGNGDESKKKKD